MVPNRSKPDAKPHKIFNTKYRTMFEHSLALPRVCNTLRKLNGTTCCVKLLQRSPSVSNVILCTWYRVSGTTSDTNKFGTMFGTKPWTGFGTIFILCSGHQMYLPGPCQNLIGSFQRPPGKGRIYMIEGCMLTPSFSSLPLNVHLVVHA